MTFDMTVLHKIFQNSYKFCASQRGVNYSLSAHPTRAVRSGQTSPKDRRMILLNVFELPEIGGARAISFSDGRKRNSMDRCTVKLCDILRANRVSRFTHRTIRNTVT